MLTPEGAVKKKVKAILTAHEAYYHMPVQNGMGMPTLDFVCCHKGMYLTIETKADGKLMTKRQEDTATAVRAAGGVAFCIDGNNLDTLEHWLTMVDSC
jgi:hypothetical protein|tara:strand:+ start:9949 stop:10242 length:294 start_codon:yes stop_codon:yes gene_type:complete